MSHKPLLHILSRPPREQRQLIPMRGWQDRLVRGRGGATIASAILVLQRMNGRWTITNKKTTREAGEVIATD